MGDDTLEQQQIKIKRLSVQGKETWPLPAYATPGSAGLDLRACIDNDIIIPPGGRAKITTGIAIQIPHANIVGLVFARSGNAWKYGVTLANAVGVIDSDYTGEIQVLISNMDNEHPFTVKDGDRIAQLVFMPVMQVQLVEVDALTETERGEGGFGSTGRS